MKCIDCENYFFRSNLSDHKKLKHKIQGERGSKTNHGSLRQVEIEIDKNRTLSFGPCFCGKTYLMM